MGNTNFLAQQHVDNMCSTIDYLTINVNGEAPFTITMDTLAIFI